MHTESTVTCNRDEARALFRELHNRTGIALELHAQASVAEARGDLKKAAPIFLKRMQADAAFAADMEVMERLMKQLWPPIKTTTIVPSKSRSRKQRNRHV